MTPCPECGHLAVKRSKWDIPLDVDFLLQIDIDHCTACGWVTVRNWRWIDPDKERTP